MLFYNYYFSLNEIMLLINLFGYKSYKIYVYVGYDYNFYESMYNDLSN